MDLSNYQMQCLEMDVLSQSGISVQIARFDKIHPLVSGNKLYKLYYFLELAAKKNIRVIKTFGGAYSNHLLATAAACQQAGLQSIGYVRGETSLPLNETLSQCRHLGMQLAFLSREVYSAMSGEFAIDEDSLIIPEGGYHPLGAKGAALMAAHPAFSTATHIFVAVGTATTLAGLMQACRPHQQLIAVPVLKGMTDIPARMDRLNEQHPYGNLIIAADYHFGGYAKKSTALLDFMNQLYRETALPTDFVYTGKMMYAAIDLIRKGQIPATSKVICIHTGGLQGNRGLPKGSLIF